MPTRELKEDTRDHKTHRPATATPKRYKDDITDREMLSNFSFNPSKTSQETIEKILLLSSCGKIHFLKFSTNIHTHYKDWHLPLLTTRPSMYTMFHPGVFFF
jgi:hypothetical protein